MESYVSHLRYGPVELKFVEGKDGLKAYCPIIKRELNRGARVLIVFDADDDYEKTKSEIEKAVQDKTGKNSENSHLDFFLFPNDKDPGNLEDLLEKIIRPEHEGLFDCFEVYKRCLTERDPSYVHPDKKAKIYAYKQSLGAIREGREDHFSPKYWDFENGSLDPLKHFLSGSFHGSDPGRER